VGDPSPWSALPHRWIHVQLPGYRQLPQHNTYESSQVADLPLIPIGLDDHCEWLRTHGLVHAQGGLNQYERDIQPSFVEELVLRAHIQLPKSFRRFMTHPELQSRVRSCTDCYLDPGERIVETIGSIPGHLVHFLSDSQSCSHWYLHILHRGDSACSYHQTCTVSKSKTHIGLRIPLAILNVWLANCYFVTHRACNIVPD